SSVSPTNFGGSAVAFFLLIQERISAARATSIVLYTIIADTLFFVISFPIVLILFGRIMFYPIADGGVWSGMGATLVVVWLVMAAYGLLLAYGLFVQPRQLRRLLSWMAGWRLLSRSKDRILKAAVDIEASSLRIRKMPLDFHGRLVLATLLAWALRFFTVTAILIALNPQMSQTLMDHVILLGRGQSLYAVTAYSPTPGGSGVAEIIFGQFYQEYVSKGVAVIAAVIWRIITYYPYLILGVIIIPNWIRKLINRRRFSTEFV
ncbi:MAG: lysylphosphatidylglycerol synthase transmembrane domain-containing protein, partial [Bacteroidota bacterium]